MENTRLTPAKDIRPASGPNPFNRFYQTPFYLEFKNHLYNYRLRRAAIQKSMAQNAPQGKILEVGSGVSIMAEGENVVYSDLSQEAIDYLHNASITTKGMVASATELPIKEQAFEVIVCSEVLEHIKNDEAALREFHRILKPEGSLVLTVPIHPKYYGYDDAVVEHDRRYEVLPFIKQLKALGFHVVETRKVTGFLDKLLMTVAARLYAFWDRPSTSTQKVQEQQERRSQNSSWLSLALKIYKPVNRLLEFLVRWDAAIMPLSATAVLLLHCRKRKES